jgi:translation elongation factor EF-Ts
MSDSKQLVKQLREMTGAGILDCKKYLIKANNNIDQNLASKQTRKVQE